jgi:hypothetical protein
MGHEKGIYSCATARDLHTVPFEDRDQPATFFGVNNQRAAAKITAFEQ